MADSEGGNTDLICVHSETSDQGSSDMQGRWYTKGWGWGGGCYNEAWLYIQGLYISQKSVRAVGRTTQ